MLKPEFSGQFKKDYKLAVKRGCDPEKLKTGLASGLSNCPPVIGAEADPHRLAQRFILIFPSKEPKSAPNKIL